jgi:ferredoxin
LSWLAFGVLPVARSIRAAIDSLCSSVRPERERDPVDRHVVVRRTDAARGEHEVVGLVHHAHVLGDHLDVVGDRDDALDVDAERAQLPAEIGRVGVDHLPGEDLVSDHEDAGGGHAGSIQGPRFAALGAGPTLPAMDVQVRFPAQGCSVSVPSGTLLIDAGARRDLPIASACRGDGLCGRCGVAIVAGSATSPAETAEETRCKERNRIDPGLRLACRIRVHADLDVTAPYW